MTPRKRSALSSILALSLLLSLAFGAVPAIAADGDPALPIEEPAPPAGEPVPPVEAPALAATALSAVQAPGRVAYGGNGGVKAVLSSAGVALAGKSVAFQASTDGVTWADAGTVLTDESGTAVLKAKLVVATLFRVSFAGDEAFAASESAAVRVAPAAALSKPKATAKRVKVKAVKASKGKKARAATVVTGRSFSVTIPHATTGQVTFKVSKPSRGKYVAVTTVDATSVGGTWTTGAIVLPRGTYRLVATYAGDDFATTSTSTVFQVR